MMGNKVRREVTRYLTEAQKRRGATKPSDPLWISDEGTRLTKSGLRMVVARRAAKAHLPEPGLHEFRRTFAIERLRNGADIFSLMSMMGHTTPQILMRYLRMVQTDLERVNETTSPVDKM